MPAQLHAFQRSLVVLQSVWIQVFCISDQFPPAFRSLPPLAVATLATAITMFLLGAFKGRIVRQVRLLLLLKAFTDYTADIYCCTVLCLRFIFTHSLDIHSLPLLPPCSWVDGRGLSTGLDSHLHAHGMVLGADSRRTCSYQGFG